jgi:predicted CoA-binding protein
MDDAQLTELLKEVHTIAVVGLSSETSKDSYRVASYLQEHGYRIIPVTPRGGEILGEKAYPDLKSIPENIDVVDVFRRPEFLPAIAEEAAGVRAKVLWMQLGISNEEAARIASSAGLTVVQDACMLREHSRLMGD